MTGTLVLLRHGSSEWNELNLFTGWIDVPLSGHGVTQAQHAGDLLVRAGVLPDVVHTSVLTRAIQTANVTLERAGRLWVDVARTWRLNERHYGALTGRVKSDIVAEFGEERFTHWRRSSHGTPPPLPDDSPYDVSRDRRYAGVPVPRTESLKDTIARALPYYEQEIAPVLKAGQCVLVAAHGNSLRGIIKYLSDIGDEDIVGLEIPTGKPIVYELADDLSVESRYYLDEA